MKRTLVLIAAVAMLGAVSTWAQDGLECKGDFNDDGRVSIDELVTAVNAALKGCDANATQRMGCLASDGVVSSGSCCSTAPDFPDSCGIGSCGCAPQFSREVMLCDCGAGKCFNRAQSACVVR